MKRLWMTVVIITFAWGLMAQDPNRTLRPQQATTHAETAEARTALIIGNGAYLMAPLKNPVRDARAMAEALRKCGFRVTLLEDATRARMVAALRDFGQAIQGGGVGLLYYAGHGMQVKGRNYLVPVDADLASEDEVPYNTLDADAVLAKMESARNRLNILILDACRNNPFARSFRSSAQGLAQMDAPAGSYIAFATSPGRTAADGAGSHGLYTQHLLDQLAIPGIKVEDVFKRVRASVMRDSQQQQVPWESSSITGDFYFVAGTGSSANRPVGPLASPAVELAYWDSIKGSSNTADFKAYLSRYPEGSFADLARNRLAALGSSALHLGLDPILRECLQARGGLEALQGVRGLKLRGSVFDLGGPSPFTRELSYPRRFLQDVQIAEAIVRFGSDGLRGWVMGTSLDRSRVLQAPTLLGEEELRLLAGFMEVTDPMVLGAEGIGRVQVSASSNWEGRSVQTIQIVLADGREYLYWINPATHLPLGYRVKLAGVMTAAQDMDFRLGDYRRVGGLLYPFRVDLYDATKNAWQPKEALEEVIVNPAFEPDHFKAPADLRPPQADTAEPPPVPAAAEGSSLEALQQKAKGGDPEAMTDLGLRHETGDGVKADVAEAVRWYRQAAQKGHPRAQCFLGAMLQNGNGVAKDQAQAIQWYRKSADRGWPDAQFRLAWAYQYGEGLPKDAAKAAQGYRKAADGGHALAMTNLGWMYENGHGVPQDHAQAVALYQKAADAGEATAQCNLGLMFESGRGTAMDLRQAVSWYRKSAEQGDARGQKSLGVLLRDGMGADKNLEEAARWFKAAAEQGQGDAQVALGLLYSDGLGVPADDAQMASWFLKAANAGHASGQSCLGWAYETGRGVGVDPGLAVQWYRKAARQGQQEAKVALVRLGQK